MQAQFRYAMRHDPESVRILARRFSTTIGRICRSIGNSRLQLSCATCAVTTSASGGSSIQLGVLCRPPWPTIQPGKHSIRDSALLRLSTCSLRVSNVPAPFLPALPWMLTSLSERLSWPCQSSPMAKLLAGPASLPSFCSQRRNMWPWTMAAVRRSGS